MGTIVGPEVGNVKEKVLSSSSALFMDMSSFESSDTGNAVGTHVLGKGVGT